MSSITNSFIIMVPSSTQPYANPVSLAVLKEKVTSSSNLISLSIPLSDPKGYKIGGTSNISVKCTEIETTPDSDILVLSFLLELSIL